MIRFIRKIPFVHKMLLLVAVILTLALGTYSFQQTKKSLRIMEQDTLNNLSLLTEQVLENHRQNRSTLEQQVYTRASTVEMPEKMRAYDFFPSTDAKAELQYAVNQMVTVSTIYDFAYIQTMGGGIFHTGSKIEESTCMISECSKVLAENEKNTHGSCRWTRSADGEIYLIKDVYSVSPMRRCGRLILHIVEDRLFTLSKQGIDMNCTMIFYDNQSQFYYTAGQTISQTLLLDIIKQSVNQTQTKVNLGSLSYYISVFRSNSLTAIGLIPTSHLYKANQEVMKSNLLYGAVILCISLLVLLVSTYSFSRKIKALVHSMNVVANGNLDYKVTVSGEDDISQMAVEFNHMVYQVKELLNRLLKEQQLKSNAELNLLESRYRTLQMQIKPHFVYNALESINAVAKINGNDQISNMVQRISRYFRSITINMDKQYIPVEREIKTLSDYTGIYNDIYGSRLRMVITVEDTVSQCLIPTMILQPIVENALIHGLSTVITNPTLKITVRAENSVNLYLAIENNGHPISKEDIDAISNHKKTSDDKGSIGIANIRERLQIIYGNKSSLLIYGGEYGTRVIITIPICYYESDSIEDFM